MKYRTIVADPPWEYDVCRCNHARLVHGPLRCGSCPTGLRLRSFHRFRFASTYEEFLTSWEDAGFGPYVGRVREAGEWLRLGRCPSCGLVPPKRGLVVGHEAEGLMCPDPYHIGGAA